MRKRTQRDRAFWEQVKAAHDAGEGNYSALARRYDVSLSTLHLQMRKLRTPHSGALAPVRMLPVTVTSAPLAGVVVEHAGYRVRFAPGADPRYLAAVLRALGS